MSRTDRRVHVVSALLVAVCAVIMWRVGWGSIHWWAFPAMVAAVTIAEMCTIKLQIGKQHWLVALTEAALSAAFVFAPGTWCVPATALGVVIAMAVRKPNLVKMEFNAAQFAVAAAIGSLVSEAAGNNVFGAACGIGAFWLVQTLLVAMIIWLTGQGGRLRDIVDVSGLLSLVNAAGNASMGLLGAWLTLHAPFGLLALVVPCALLWVSYDQQTRQAFETRLFSELADGQERVSGRSSDGSARVVLTAAARLFGGDSEMVLMTADGPVRYVGDDRNVMRQRVEQDVFNEAWVLRALGSRAVTTGIDEGRPYCSAVLGDVQAPLAVLITRRPVGGESFDRREQTMAGVLIRQAASWMSVAELTESRDEALEIAEAAGEAARALGDMGANTWPAMVSLRESAARLGRLATMPEGPDPVGDIVGELHAAERAVASLLGAIALAADPELARALDSDELRLPDTDSSTKTRVPDDDVWTTTGVLEVEAADIPS
jgi:hypothetical protein